MSEILPTFYTKYRGHQFTLDFAQHPNGVTLEIEASNLPLIRDGHLWPDYESAKAHGIEEARRLIDTLIEQQ